MTTTMKRAARRSAWSKAAMARDWKRRDFWPQYKLLGALKPFKALEAYTVKLRAAYAHPAGGLRQLALAALRPLRHRGHGGKHRTKQRTVFGRNMADRSAEYNRRAG